jgi:hypothetical protein
MLTFALYVFTFVVVFICCAVACAIGYMILEAHAFYKARKQFEKRVREVIEQ